MQLLISEAGTAQYSRAGGRPRSWMQVAGVSLLCVCQGVPAGGGNLGGWPGAIAAGAAGSGLGTPGIWAERGGTGSPRTLVLPGDAQVSGGSTCRFWAAS